MNKPLSKKLRSYIMKKAYNSLPFGGSVWDSSAKNLENDLKMRGIDIKKKLFYEYKLPAGMSHQEFQDHVAISKFCNEFYSEFMPKVFGDKNLTMLEKMQIVGWVWKMRREKKVGKEKVWEKEIKEKNPELAHINGAVVYGALFGFAPEEIEYFSSEYCDRRHANDVIDEIERLSQGGVHVTYVLAPSTADKVVKALKAKYRGM